MARAVGKIKRPKIIDTTYKECAMKYSKACLKDSKKKYPDKNDIRAGKRVEKEIKSDGSYNAVNFYRVINNNLFKTDTVHICKDCIKEYVHKENGEVDLHRFKRILQLIDVPFLSREYTSAVESDKSTLGSYMKNIYLNYRGYGWEDGDKDEFYRVIGESVKTDKEIKAFWGNGFTDEDYEYLESQLSDLKTDFECSDAGMKIIMKDIAFTNLYLHQERTNANPNQKTIKDLISTRSSLMNDGNLKPIQSTGANANDQSTYGVFIDKLEKTRPASEPLDEWKDPDNIREIAEIFAGQLGRMFDIKSAFIERFKKILKPFTVKPIQTDEDVEE